MAEPATPPAVSDDDPPASGWPAEWSPPGSPALGSPAGYSPPPGSPALGSPAEYSPATGSLAVGSPAGGTGPGGLPPVLADARLAPLWLAAHRRLEETGGQLAGASLRLRATTDDQRAAVDRLLGVRRRAAEPRIPLDGLDQRLRGRTGWSLVDVVTATVGALRDRPGERAAVAGSEAAMWDRLAAHPALHRHPALAGWLHQVRGTGAWRRLDQPEGRLTAALDVLAHLPQTVRRGRSRVAARVLGDAHGLDELSSVGRLTTAALAYLAGLGGPLRAGDRRRLWADQGVVADETSSTVLTLGLRPDPVGPLTEAAGRWAEGLAPLPIPLAAVGVERWRVAPGTRIWACENPSVLAAAAGTAAAMICLEGRPSLACLLLLRGLVEGGARIAYHGDFGAGGIAIANAVIGEMGAEPWRFGVEDHRFALARAELDAAGLRPLRGAVPDACWDPDLAPAVRAGGVEVEEELVIDLLLGDLERG